MTVKQLLAKIEAIGDKYIIRGPYFTGSRAICPDATTEDTDWDYVVQVNKKNVYPFCAELYYGLKMTYANHITKTYLQGCVQVVTYHNHKTALKLQIMITTSDKQFRGWKEATKGAMAKKLYNKTDRVAFFNNIHIKYAKAKKP